jgi:hypothetical protein
VKVVASTIALVPEQLYYYRQNVQGSTTSTLSDNEYRGQTINRLDTYYFIYKQNSNFLLSRGYDIQDLLLLTYLFNIEDAVLRVKAAGGLTGSDIEALNKQGLELLPLVEALKGAEKAKKYKALFFEQ